MHLKQLVTSIYSNCLTILQKLFGANFPRFGLAIKELPSDFQTHFFSFKTFCSVS